MALERKGIARAYVVGIAFWLFAFIITLKMGAVGDASVEVISQLRLPRAVLATAVGMGLAVAGAVLQALFANPLCEPYTLGVSSGASLGAVIGASLGFQWILAGMTVSAFLGAILFAAILYLISRRSERGNLTLLLSGVMLGFLGSSLVAVWMAFADVNGIQGALFWLLGDLSRARLSGAFASLGMVVFLGSLIWARSRELDALLVGEDSALSLGVDVSSVRRKLIFQVSILIGVCVSGAGMIGFIGLIVPHFARRMVGSMHGRLLPLAAIWGAASLTAADGLARMVARPYELPVGVVTALVGAPVFIWVILRKRTRFA